MSLSESRYKTTVPDTPLVSIITTALNSENTIESTINSVLNQTYCRIEYIVIDGGSTDRTLEIVNRYSNRITDIITEPDEGIYDGMNKGIKVASGEIIGILNSDDVYASDNVIEMVVNQILETRVDVCWGDIVYVDKENPERVIRYWKSSEYKEGKFKKGWHPPHPSFFVTSTIYKKYGCFNLEFSIAGDYELMLRFLEKYRVKPLYIPQQFVRMTIGGSSNRNMKNIVKANIQCYRAWRENGLNICPLRILLKPLLKVPQFFTR